MYFLKVRNDFAFYFYKRFNDFGIGLLIIQWNSIFYKLFLAQEKTFVFSRPKQKTIGFLGYSQLGYYVTAVFGNCF